MKNIFSGMLLVFLNFNLDIGSSRIGLIPNFLGYIFIAKGLKKLVGNRSTEEKSILRAAVTTLHEALKKGGPIGGLAQTGTYKVDCRFNKADIRSKIETIAKLKGKIKLYNKDAGYLIRMNLMKMKAPLFLNIDPPYVIKGSQLYTNFFTEGDHLNLQRVIVKHLDDEFPWIITYDDCQLVRDLYRRFHMEEYGIIHNAGGSVQGKEIVITNLPNDRFVWN